MEGRGSQGRKGTLESQKSKERVEVSGVAGKPGEWKRGERDRGEQRGSEWRKGEEFRVSRVTKSE